MSIYTQAGTYAYLPVSDLLLFLKMVMFAYIVSKITALNYMMSVWKHGSILIIILVSTLCVASAQEVRMVATSIKPADSLQILKLLHKSSRMQNSDPDSMIQLAEIAFRKSIDNNFNEGAAWSLGLIATGYRNQGDYAASIKIYKRSIPFVEKIRKDKAYYLAATYTAMVGSYFPQGMYDSAAINCYKVIDLYRNNSNINPEKGSVSPLIDAYQYLAICWLQLGFTNYAHKYIATAEALSLKDKKHYQLPGILANKGSIYLEENKPDSALAAFAASKENTHPDDITRYRDLEIHIAAAYLQKNLPEKAIALLERHTKQVDSLAVSNDIRISASYVLAKAYYQKGNYQKALAILLPAMQEASSRNLKYNALSPYTTLAGIYRAQGKTAEAYDQLKIMLDISDSLRNKDKVQAINVLDVNLQTAEKDNKIINNQLRIAYQDNKLREKNTWIGISFAGMAILGIFLGLLYRSGKQKRRLQQQIIQNLNNEREIVRLRSVMHGEEKERARFARELHDGFISQLSAIKMNFSVVEAEHSSKEKHEENLVLLGETIKELQQTAHNLIPEVLLRGGLAEAIQVFCDRISRSHHLEIDCQFFGFIPPLQDEFELAIYRMVQESVHNVVKHAEATRVIVQADCSDGLLGLTIEDNGCGIKGATQEKQGLGLDNLRARSASFNGNLQITSNPGAGTMVYFEFDIKPYLKEM